MYITKFAKNHLWRCVAAVAVTVLVVSGLLSCLISFMRYSCCLPNNGNSRHHCRCRCCRCGCCCCCCCFCCLHHHSHRCFVSEREQEEDTHTVIHKTIHSSAEPAVVALLLVVVLLLLFFFFSFFSFLLLLLAAPDGCIHIHHVFSLGVCSRTFASYFMLL